MEGIRKHHVSTQKKIIDSVKDHQSLMDAKVIQWRFVEEDTSEVPRLVPVITCQLKSKKKQKQTAMEQCNLDQFIKLQFSSVTQSCPTLCDSIDHSMAFFPAAETPPVPRAESEHHRTFQVPTQPPCGENHCWQALLTHTKYLIYLSVPPRE